MLLNWHYDMTLSIWKKAMGFSALAQQNQKSPDEQAYHQFVKEELPRTNNLQYIEYWFDKWSRKSFFRLADWISRIEYLVLNSDVNSSLGIIKSSFQSPFKEQIITYILTNILNDKPIWFGIDEYFWYEEEGIPAELLRRAQAFMVEQILADSGAIKVDEAELASPEEQASIDHAKNWMADQIAQLMDRAKKFPPQFLERLTKHLGVDAYIATLNRSHGLHGAKIRNKEIYNKYDIAYLFSSYLRSVNKADMLNIIGKCTDTAKQYMRGYLYEDTKRMEHVDAYFMLSEDMSPMNIDYQSIAWPEGIRILTLDELGEAQRNKWGKVFQEFGIIPSS